MSWFAVVSIALYLNYLGQGALVVRDPKAVSNPFYLLAPDSLQLPLVILATLATVIASQAVISGAFSMTEQAVNLRYLPRMIVTHTSASERGQIYVPLVNWLLLAAVILLVIGFRDSSRLASAYGLAVSGTFVITTLLTTVVARHKWHVTPAVLGAGRRCVPVHRPIVLHGQLDQVRTRRLVPPARRRCHLRDAHDVVQGPRVAASTARGDRQHRRPVGVATRERPGRADPRCSAVYVTADVRPPLAMLEYLRLGGTVHRQSIHLAVMTARAVPFVAPADQLTVSDVAPGFQRAVLRLGFMQRADIPTVMQQMADAGLPLDDQTILVVYTTRVNPHGREGMMLWRKHVFAFMLRNAVDPVSRTSGSSPGGSSSSPTSSASERLRTRVSSEADHWGRHGHSSNRGAAGPRHVAGPA